MVFEETSIFTKRVTALLHDDSYAALQHHLVQHPDAGDVIRGSGGLRKVRWSRPGQGKRGGVRVITYARAEGGQVWLLIGYTKARFDKLPTEFLVNLRKEMDDAQDDGP